MYSGRPWIVTNAFVFTTTRARRFENTRIETSFQVVDGYSIRSSGRHRSAHVYLYDWLRGIMNRANKYGRERKFEFSRQLRNVKNTRSVRRQKSPTIGGNTNGWRSNTAESRAVLFVFSPPRLLPFPNCSDPRRAKRFPLWPTVRSGSATDW